MASWLLVLASAIALGAGVYGEVLAPSVVLDLVSFWPGLVVAVLLALAVWPFRHRGPGRLGAVLPLLLLTWVWAVMALHLAEWDLLPSSSVDLAGPSVGTMGEVVLSAGVRGVLELSVLEGDRLYTVRPHRQAGPVGVPEALERLEGSRGTVRLLERDPGPWFGSEGWRLALAPGPAWRLHLEAAGLRADLRSLRIRELTVLGEGALDLPSATEEVAVSLEGRWVVSIPEGTGVVVEGAAEVPPDWVVTDTGWRSPTREPGYAITVIEGSRVRISRSP